MTQERKNSVLVVDDEKANILMLTYILGPHYTVYAAKNGRDAIEAANEYLPDVILLDIVMPGMDGYEVFSILKKGEKTKGTPVIFITGLNDSKEEEKGLSAGAADYIGKPFNPSVVKLRVKNQIQIMNYLQEIERMSKTDQLTGIHNRRSFDALLNAEWKLAARENTPISLLMVDIDSFKTYNDTYGHQQGDAALQATSKVLSQVLKRPRDFAARWGGEEFAVLLHNTSQAGALEVAEQIRAGVEREVILLTDGTATKITVSVGVNTLIPGQGDKDTTDGFISGADEELYKAKDKGRNCVCQAKY